MNWALEKVQPNSTWGRTAGMDLFDVSGSLLLKKGLPLTDGIRELLRKREVYAVESRGDSHSSGTEVTAFPKDVYVELVGSLWSIYHEAKLIEPEQIEKTVRLVETIIREFRENNVYLNFESFQLDEETFKQHDYGTFIHSINVALLSALMGMRLKYPVTKLRYLTLGALLHDLGKIQVPREILNKPGSLTEEERYLVQQHPVIGEKMLENTRLLPNVRAIVRGHHERWNGQGYPDGLIGTGIHRDAHIVAVADVYEALTADRPYRKGIPPYHALEMLLSWSGKDFNPHVVEAFRKALILYPGNAVVTLNTGEVGRVVSVPKEMPTRPLVRLLFDRDGKFANRETYIDLMEKLTCFIQRVEFGEAESARMSGFPG